MKERKIDVKIFLRYDVCRKNFTFDTSERNL